jgi:hypothetical protein
VQKPVGVIGRPGWVETEAAVALAERLANQAGTDYEGGKQVGDHVWLVTFMEYDLGYFDDETCRLEPIDNPFGPKLLPMSPE